MIWYKTDRHKETDRYWYREKVPLNSEQLKILYRFPDDKETAIDMASIKSLLGVHGHYADRTTSRDQVMNLVDRGLVRIVKHPRDGTGYEYFELTKEGRLLRDNLRKKRNIESLIGAFFVILAFGILFYGVQTNVITGNVIKDIVMDKTGIIELTIILLLFILGIHFISKNLRHL